MTRENQTTISNTKLPDSSSKLIFGDNVLSAQFFRDYADLEILRNIRPEDVEDVSGRYVPLYGSERESDTVKKVDITRYLSEYHFFKEDENQLDLPLYIVSLIEHKTKTEYNVVMQILRYMVFIWEDYEKEMNRQHKGISDRKDFRYPPILPIVYYEGEGAWTAPMDLSERILCGELLGKYLPHFTYQLVRLHDYSNEELLKKRDEISIAMLINKIQNPEDMEAFVEISGREVEEILRDTPDYLLETMSRVMRALLYSMNLPEKETESMVSMIKERKMGRLFENVTMDIQKERRERARAEAERDAAVERLNAAGRAFEIYKYVSQMLRRDCPEEEIKKTLRERFSLTEEEADAKYRKVLEEY